METTATVTSAHRLKRVLTLWDLIFYGIVLIQPIAPVPLYGVAQKLSDGHFAAIILIAMFAMLITAVSYGDRKSTRLNSSHITISYAVFCLKKKTQKNNKYIHNNKIKYLQ